ncbi:hypothetical protein CFC21_005761 [Triticum aestivum]|uniref:Uncharacterized protein n=2 Tax=Triticum aestivum TaxID=4565 RepID=A0A3B5YT63_WHEAT|nr:hypothetical protein CFC21_005761 [Triticum aestivum]
MCRGAVTRPHRHDQGDNSSPTPTTAQSSVARRAPSDAPRGHRRLSWKRGRPPVHVPIATAGQPHDVTLVQLEARAVVDRLRLLQQAKKPKRPPTPGDLGISIDRLSKRYLARLPHC